jgi:dihydropteroate synthase
MRSPRILHIGSRRLELGRKTLVMGVLNVTPDSFSDGGLFASEQSALKHALHMLDEGADFIDVGGESARPGAQPISAEEEMARVLPVIQALVRERPDAMISIDTCKSEVARHALAAGACLVNDISALGDERMGEVVASAQAALCLMHMQGIPQSMQQSPQYDNVTSEVCSFLKLATERAMRHGISPHQLLVDPGIGFGKTLAHNLTLLRELEQIKALGHPVLLGISRKSFLGALLEQAPVDARVVPSVALGCVLAVQGHIDVLRVHDVKLTVDALRVVRAVTGDETSVIGLAKKLCEARERP